MWDGLSGHVHGEAEACRDLRLLAFAWKENRRSCGMGSRAFQRAIRIRGCFAGFVARASAVGIHGARGCAKPFKFSEDGDASKESTDSSSLVFIIFDRVPQQPLIENQLSGTAVFRFEALVPALSPTLSHGP